MYYLLTILIINLVIITHEYGHYLAARRLGIPVKIFSIGFGPRIAGYYKNGTDFRLALIPLGGYVLPAMDDDDQFLLLPVNHRILLAAGGPMINLFFAFIGLLLINIMSNGWSVNNLLVQPFMQFASLLNAMVFSIISIFTHPGELSGIIGIVSQGGRYMAQNQNSQLTITGFTLLKSLKFFILLSLNLGLINFLPVPALDGGKILLYLLEKIHPRFRRWQIPLAIAGWVLIFGLFVYVTILDLRKCFGFV